MKQRLTFTAPELVEQLLAHVLSFGNARYNEGHAAAKARSADVVTHGDSGSRHLKEVRGILSTAIEHALTDYTESLAQNGQRYEALRDQGLITLDDEGHLTFFVTGVEVDAMEGGEFEGYERDESSAPRLGDAAPYLSDYERQSILGILPLDQADPAQGLMGFAQSASAIDGFADDILTTNAARLIVALDRAEHDAATQAGT